MPLRRLLIEARFQNMGFETDVLTQPVFVRRALEIAEQNVLRGIVIRPIVVRLEAERIHVVWIVHAAAGIGILQPCPADIGVLLDHIEGYAGLLQANGGEDAAHAGADHDNAHSAACRAQFFGVPMRMLYIFTGKAEFLLHERHVVFGNVRAGEEIHHLAHGGGRRRRRKLLSVHQIGFDRVLGARANGRLLRFGIAAKPSLGEEVVNRPRKFIEDGSVTRHMHQRHQKRGQMRLLQPKVQKFFARHVFVLLERFRRNGTPPRGSRQANESAKRKAPVSAKRPALSVTSLGVTRCGRGSPARDTAFRPASRRRLCTRHPHCAHCRRGIRQARVHW